MCLQKSSLILSRFNAQSNSREAVSQFGVPDFLYNVVLFYFINLLNSARLKRFLLNSAAEKLY